MPVTTTLTDAPDAPQRSDPANFRADADTFVDWMANTFVDEMQAVIAEFNATFDNIWSATSTTSLTIGTGSKTFTISETEVAFAVGSTVRISDNSDPGTNYMEGVVTAYTSSTGSMTVSVSDSDGSGTISDWTISYIPSIGFFLAKTSNLSDLDDADDALDNLGGTTTGKAIFKAENVAAVKTTLSISNVPNEDATDPANWNPAKTDGNFLVGNGSTFVAESGSTARTSMGAQETLVSGTNIKTIDGESILGSGALSIAGLVFLSSATASNDATIEFTGLDSTYDGYVFFFNNIVSEDDSSVFALQSSPDNGTTWRTTDTYYNSSDTSITIKSSVASFESVSGFGYIAKKATVSRIGIGGCVSTQGSGSAWGGTVYDTGVTAVRFFFKFADYIESGKIFMYGVKTS